LWPVSFILFEAILRFLKNPRDHVVAVGLYVGACAVAASGCGGDAAMTPGSISAPEGLMKAIKDRTTVVVPTTKKSGSRSTSGRAKPGRR
jgi:hypothetical protein